MQLTTEQAAIQDAAAGLKSGDSLKVIAFAGAGKTTTLKACAQAREDRGVYLAFNSSIAKEAKEKLGATKCSASTMHALAWSAMRELAGKPEALAVRELAYSDILANARLPVIRGWGSLRVASAVIRTMNAFAASDDQEIMSAHARSALIASIGDPAVLDRIQAGQGAMPRPSGHRSVRAAWNDLKTGDSKAERAREILARLTDPLVNLAHDWWVHRMKERKYSHDMYLKMLDLDEDMRMSAFRGFRYIMIDEAQDINPVQRSIITQTGLPLVAVGDPYQQIYSWRGAENALDRLPGQELHLTQSFRFGEAIAADARRILATRPDGGPNQRLIGAGPGPRSGTRTRAIICRTNVGRLTEAMKCMERNLSFAVDNIAELREQVESALALYNGDKAGVKASDLRCYETWDELKDVAEYTKEPGLERLVELVESERAHVLRQIEEKQSRKADPSRIFICTAHRSKGLEFDVVRLGDDWPDLKAMQKRYEKARDMSPAHEETAREAWNCLYVAVTRSIIGCKGHEKLLEEHPQQDNASATLPEPETA